MYIHDISSLRVKRLNFYLTGMPTSLRKTISECSKIQR